MGPAEPQDWQHDPRAIKRCARCGMDESGRGIMCARSDAEPVPGRLVLWAIAAVIAFVVLVMVLQ